MNASTQWRRSLKRFKKKNQQMLSKTMSLREKLQQSRTRRKDSRQSQTQQKAPHKEETKVRRRKILMMTMVKILLL